jgi:RNA polymerase sigma factor (sigma-70 family)
MLRLRQKHQVGFASSVLVRTHDHVFLDRYDWLLGWAERFTGSREDAADIVHDAFVQFTLKQPKLGEIANLDAYLCTMIRNLHVSLVRRRASKSMRLLLLVDYDSFHAGLRAVDPTLGLRSEEQLRLICRYACERKGTAKAASILVLRFFHGFHVGEIALILRCSRQAVEVRL